jgi:hypothetical protein
MSVGPTIPGIESLTLMITQEIHVNASLETTFESLLEQLGPENETPEQKMPMKLEPWPGGRWFRDLGDGNGHFWGHVQAIKGPTLLEITGPLFMSYGVVSNLQYRLSEANGSTLIKFHQGLWTYPGRAPQGRQPGLESHEHARESSRGVESKVGGNMCPACIASVGIVVGSVVSAGGATALVMKVLRSKKTEKSISKEKEQ